MQLLELSLHNFKVHRKKTLTFAPGVVGIVGDNGSGKSSIIEAICFLFTGDTGDITRQQCITLGETEGWVKGKFSLNGKEGTLERWLTGSKVILTYDGVTYNKVSDVNQLWTDLLQIDSTIFNNVIVAKQNEIQKLFSDETAVREKIFQKIFMVPPTEKIRNVIWDNYIKVCPPEKPEEDVQLLVSTQSQVASERNRILAEIDVHAAGLLDDNTMRSIEQRIVFLEKCIVDSRIKPELEESLGHYLLEERANDISIVNLREAINALPGLDILNQKRLELLASKSEFSRKQSMINEISILEKSIDIKTTNEHKVKLADLEKSKNEYYDTLSQANTRLKEVIAQKNQLLQLRGHAKCPTCNQDIQDPENYINQLMAQEIELNGMAAKTNSAYQSVIKQIQTLQALLSKFESIKVRKSYLEEGLAKLSDVTYSEDDLLAVNTFISQREKLLQEQRDTQSRQVEIGAEIRVLKEKLKNLAIYNGTTSIDEELTAYRAGVQAFKDIQETISKLQLEAGKLEHELILLDSRISNSRVNSEYNNRRKQYLEKLKDLHDLFAVSKFPRKLIESYMDTVQASLSTYLDYFDIPYTVRVTDGFKIRLFDGHDTPLPSVSGGQEIMIGICLRLALHRMFAQSFPIWIIDEGSNHLSETKRQNYFQLVDMLRKQRIINQIIVIDHDERLSTVVDQSIEL